MKAPTLRFKTEQEFLEEFGQDWRGDVRYQWVEAMDYLLGKQIDPDKLLSTGRPDLQYYDNFSVSSDMVTSNPLANQLTGNDLSEVLKMINEVCTQQSSKDTD